MKTILITGANRGIGLALTKIYLESGNTVYACCRNTASASNLIELQKSHPDNLQIEPVDLATTSSIDALVERLSDKPIDIVINNAGMTDTHQTDMSDLSQDDFLSIINVNCFASLYLSQALLPQIKKSQTKLIVSISSGLSSISLPVMGGYYGYRASKAALNSAMRGLAIDNQADGVSIILLHPGVVQTEMTGFTGFFSADEAAANLFNQIHTQHEARFANALINFDGTIIEV